ncbi:MAG: accessory Sec system translocase SecA2 [Lachnospiraceae bacterium]|nr:accessory Sec system translocase SecA2 [Lachnospiraceae bacterium]
MGQKKTIKNLRRELKKVRSNKDYMASLSDEELSGLTIQFKERLRNGESLDSLLPEAFAAVCEADYRILGKAPYDVQVLGAIAMHQGKLVEMNTGEGKTLVATMPLYLNALTGKSTILMTSNSYLVLRDAEEMGQVYNFMGLTIAAGVRAREEEQFSNEDKKKVYAADIVYTTHGTFGFDYLLNNLVTSAEDRFLRELYYCILDEADSVLLDSAQTPLVISGFPRVQSNLYEMADFFVTTLVEGRDYEHEDQKVWLTEDGIRYAETYFGIDNFYGEEFFEINRHVTLALRAHVLFEPEKDYVVNNKQELQLLDNGSGRAMSGVKLRGGQHQAIEQKEKLEVSRENRSMASITYQNLFRLFPKMSGMSGTISDAEEELSSLYGVKMVVIPPNRPLMRKDLDDFYFKNSRQQLSAAMNTIAEVHSTGQPLLIVVSTIGETELVSKMLMEMQIPHSVLNANNAFWEAEIIKEAGQLNAVTVATGMAGRGTDIRLGKGVKELGGLAVIGIGRMVNTRQERQARGRAGRQGDPGFSRFFVSLEDEVVKNSGVIKKEKYEKKNLKIRKRKLRKIINTAQKINEEKAINSRQTAMDYDQVLQRQRSLIYATRDRMMDGEELEMKKILQVAGENINCFLNEKSELTEQTIRRYILDNLSYRLDKEFFECSCTDKTEMLRYLRDLVVDGLREQENKLGSETVMGEFMRVATLQAIDEAWIEQVDYLQQLQYAVAGRSTAQRNPIYEYQKEALLSFRKMEKTIQRNMVRNILLSTVSWDKDGNMKILYP